MFGSSKNEGVPTQISREATFQGSLTLKGSLYVDGRVEGDLDVDGDVTVQPNGVVVGQLSCERLTVAGRIEGQVRVRGLLRIQKGGSVRDSVLYGSLEVEKGGSLQGHSGSLSEAEANGAGKALPASIEEPVEFEDDYDSAFDEAEAGSSHALGHA